MNVAQLPVLPEFRGTSSLSTFWNSDAEFRTGIRRVSIPQPTSLL
jgi:hypothetical protein